MMLWHPKKNHLEVVDLIIAKTNNRNTQTPKRVGKSSLYVWLFLAIDEKRCTISSSSEPGDRDIYIYTLRIQIPP